MEGRAVVDRILVGGSATGGRHGNFAVGIARAGFNVFLRAYRHRQQIRLGKRDCGQRDFTIVAINNLDSISSGNQAGEYIGSLGCAAIEHISIRSRAARGRYGNRTVVIAFAKRILGGKRSGNRRGLGQCDVCDGGRTTFGVTHRNSIIPGGQTRECSSSLISRAVVNRVFVGRLSARGRHRNPARFVAEAVGNVGLESQCQGQLGGLRQCDRSQGNRAAIGILDGNGVHTRRQTGEAAAIGRKSNSVFGIRVSANTTRGSDFDSAGSIAEAAQDIQLRIECDLQRGRLGERDAVQFGYASLAVPYGKVVGSARQAGKHIRRVISRSIVNRVFIGRLSARGRHRNRAVGIARAGRVGLRTHGQLQHGRLGQRHINGVGAAFAVLYRDRMRSRPQSGECVGNLVVGPVVKGIFKTTVTTRGGNGKHAGTVAKAAGDIGLGSDG